MRKKSPLPFSLPRVKVHKPTRTHERKNKILPRKAKHKGKEWM